MISNLKAFGLTSPYRSKRLMEQSIAAMFLNLSGLIVLTEAASKNYVHTPVIAALAGADKVYAVTRDSIYGKVSEIADFTYTLSELCGVREKIEVLTEKTQEILKEADIITNLGFVRPINSEMVAWMKDTAVIPLMCEAWEFRASDIDVEACRAKGIPVIATNEDAPGLEVFNFSGCLCLKMLFELEIEVYKSKIVVVSSDKFGRVIEKNLRLLGADVYLVSELETERSRGYLVNSDAIVIADYTSMDTFIGHKAHITTEELVNLSHGVSIVQFAGKVDLAELNKFGIRYFPNKEVGALRMGLTLASLGPKPIIDLHCAGLRVGEVAARAILSGAGVQDAEKQATLYAPGQILPTSLNIR